VRHLRRTRVSELHLQACLTGCYEGTFDHDGGRRLEEQRPRSVSALTPASEATRALDAGRTPGWIYVVAAVALSIALLVIVLHLTGAIPTHHQMYWSQLSIQTIEPLSSLRLTRPPGSSILSSVPIVIRRLSAVLLAAGLLAGNAAVCAGWLATPEARMACCTEGEECPMHKGDSQRSASARVLTQAQADSCCAAAEGQNSNQSNPSFVTAITAAVLGVGVGLPANVPALVLSDGWRPAAPTRPGPVPRHVLLSVFLV